MQFIDFLGTDSPHSSTGSLNSQFHHLLIHLPNATHSSPSPSLDTWALRAPHHWLSPPVTGGSPDPMWSPPVPGLETDSGNHSASPCSAQNGPVSAMADCNKAQTLRDNGGPGGDGDGGDGDHRPGGPPPPHGPGGGPNRDGGRCRQRGRRCYRPYSVVSKRWPILIVIMTSDS